MTKLLLGLFGLTVAGWYKKKSAENKITAGGYFLKILVNGQALIITTPISIFGYEDQLGCDKTYTYTQQNIGQVDIASYFIEVNIRHKQNRTQFTNSSPGVYTVVAHNSTSRSPFPLGLPCNLDLDVSLEDNSLPNKEAILVMNNRVNNITAIAVSSETHHKVKYDISGNFTCSFKNSANVIIPITGSYKTFVTVLK